jgi:outer membrane protein OmpA-like peptidoglycan-associated protein
VRSIGGTTRALGGLADDSAGAARALAGSVRPVAGSVRTVRSEVRRISRRGLVLARVVHFCFDRYSLGTDASATLRDLSRSIPRGRGPIRVQVDGYADAIGSSFYNRRLSARRAHRVAERLRTLIGLPRIPARRHGERPRVARNVNPDGSDNRPGRALNRRATVLVLIGKGASRHQAPEPPGLRAPPPPDC